MATPLPLTPALSLRERETPIQSLETAEALDLPTHWQRFSLSLRERAGVGGARLDQQRLNHLPGTLLALLP